jgi:DNA-directed RNA polymerase subunit E'/Rpb7
MPQKSIFSYPRLQSGLCIYPHQLHKNWKEEIIKDLSSIWIGHCTKDIGYICEIFQSNIHVLSHSIIEEGIMRVLVNFQAMTLLPFSGCQLMATIEMVTSFGIFLKYHDYLRLMSPLRYLEPHYIFRKHFSSNVFIHSNGQHTFQIHDVIPVEIVECRFEQEHFSCIVKCNPLPPVKN